MNNYINIAIEREPISKKIKYSDFRTLMNTGDEVYIINTRM